MMTPTEESIQLINEYIENLKENILNVIKENDCEISIEEINNINHDAMDGSRRLLKGSQLVIKINNDKLFYSINRIQTLL